MQKLLFYLRHQLCRIFCFQPNRGHHHQHQRQPTLQFVVSKDNITYEGFKMVNIPRNNSPITLKLLAKDAEGKLETPLAIPVWSVSNPLVTLTPAPDGLTAVCTLSGDVGTSTITVVADSATGTLELVITPLPITTVEIVVA